MSEIMGDVWKYDPGYNRLCDLLGIDKNDREDIGIAQKISVLRDYLDIGKKLTEPQALQAVQTMKRELGIPFLGKDLLNELYQHSRLEMDRMVDLPKEKPVVKEVKKETPKMEKKEPSVKAIVKEAVEGVIKGFINSQKPKEIPITPVVPQGNYVKQ